MNYQNKRYYDAINRSKVAERLMKKLYLTNDGIINNQKLNRWQLNMYFLITMHSPPHFYSVTGKQVEPSLNYIDSLTKTYIEDGEVYTLVIGSTSYSSGEGDWMVECPRVAIEQLRELNVHPFRTKLEAKGFAIEKQFKSFRYLKV